MSLVVVGSVAYDTVETPFGHRNDALGGSATYFSIAASLFTKTSLVAVVGDDFKDEHLALLEAHGADLSGVQKAPGKTFRWGGRYHDDMNGRDTLFTELNVFESFEPDLPASYRDASHVFLGNIHPSLQNSVLDQVDAPAFVAADTMNFWIEGARADLDRVLGRIDALFLNDEEAQELTGKHTVIQAARAIQAMGPKLVIIKRGEHGAILFNGDDVFYTAAYPLEVVVDPTGAGDSFAGGFMGYLHATKDLSSENIRRAAVVGTLMASFLVEGFSVDCLKAVTRESLRHRYDAFRALLAVPPLSF